MPPAAGHAGDLYEALNTHTHGVVIEGYEIVDHITILSQFIESCCC